MAIPSSGPISLGVTLPNEFGGTAPFSLSQYYRGGGRVPNGPSANANISTSGAISMSGFYGAINELILTIAANTTNYNLYNAFVATYGTPSGAVPVRLKINAGVTVGGIGTTALVLGQFPAGTVINVDNYGSIQGFGGAANSGAGGDAIYANYANQTMTITNYAGASIYGGGGGGGMGGTGGGGYYTVTVSLGSGNVGNCTSSCTSKFGSTAYCGGACNNVRGGQQCVSCARVDYYYTSGGAGGNGGVGQGYNQAYAGGAAGAAGGTNAGSGGQGGTGGNWGANGATGSTGANGNNGAGAAGSGGGSAGRYLVKGSNTVTLINSGSIAGGLA